MRSNQLFRDGDLRAYLDERRQAAQAAVQQRDPETLLNTPTPDLVAELVEQFGVQPLELRTDQMEQLPAKDEQVDVSGDFNRLIEDRSRPFYLPGTSLTRAIPFAGDAKLFTLRASTLTYNPPTGQITGNELHVTFTGVDPTAEDVTSFFDREISEIRQLVGSANRDVTRFAKEFPEAVRAMVEDRKAKLLRDRGLEGALGVPVRRRPDAPAQPVPVTRTRLGVQRAQHPRGSAPRYQPEPALDQITYEEILGIIQSMGRLLERNPTTFARLGEEKLRDHLLLQLNGTFEGQAAGELFNGAGKTDILVRVQDRNVFIGECKNWDGSKAFTDAIDQLLGYLVWRDTKAALIVFIRQQDATAVIDKADTAIREHPAFKRLGPASSDPTLRRDYVLHQPDDPNREIHVALLPLVIRQSKPTAEDASAGR